MEETEEAGKKARPMDEQERKGRDLMAEANKRMGPSKRFLSSIIRGITPSSLRLVVTHVLIVFLVQHKLNLYGIFGCRGLSIRGPHYITECLFTESRKTAFWVESPKASGRFTEQ